MIGYRLVSSTYDPVTVGSFLEARTIETNPNLNNQKIAEGMYFTPSKEEAVIFASKPHGHTYSHLLTCELVGISEQDVLDLIEAPNLITRWVRRSDYPTKKAATAAFCRDNGKKVVLWQSRSSQPSEIWKEMCLLLEYVPNTVQITHVEVLPLQIFRK
jgi:hypothetical protein